MVKWQKFASTGNMIIDLLGRNSAKKNFPPAVKASELLSTRPWLNTQLITKLIWHITLLLDSLLDSISGQLSEYPVSTLCTAWHKEMSSGRLSPKRWLCRVREQTPQIFAKHFLLSLSFCRKILWYFMFRLPQNLQFCSHRTIISNNRFCRLVQTCRADWLRVSHAKELLNCIPDLMIPSPRLFFKKADWILTRSWNNSINYMRSKFNNISVATSGLQL